MNNRETIKGMRSRLPSVLLAAALFIFLFLLTYQLWLSYRDQIKSAEIRTRNIASIFEARLNATLRRTDADLKALANEIPAAALSLQAVPRYERELNAILDSRLFNAEEMGGFRIHDANGDALYASDSEHTRRINISDQAYFQQLRADPGASLVFSDVLTCRSNNRTVLMIARALRDQHGDFMGVVLGPLNLDYYKKQFQLHDVGAQGFVVLGRSNSQMQAVRWPEAPNESGGLWAPDHPIMKWMATDENEVTLHQVPRFDHVSRIVSLKKMRNYPFYFAVGVGRDEVLAGWHSQVLVVGGAALLFFGLVGTLLFRLGRMRVREIGILTHLAQSELQFSELAKMVPVGICHFDAIGKCTYVNDRHIALTGRRREALLGCSWSDWVHPDDRAKVMEAWEKEGKGKSESAFVCEYRLVRPDGQISHVIGDVTIERGADGNILGYIVAQTDITLRKKAEAELLVAKRQAESANIAKTRFLAAASHDLRLPIQAINLFQDALGRTDLSEEQKTISRYLALSVHSLGELLYSLLDISKLDAGLIWPQLKEIPVEELFKAVDTEFSTLARQKKLRFKLFYPFNSLILLTDSGLVLSVLRNLIDNAFKYTERGGVLVGVRKRGCRGIIQVWDTGIGIDPQHGEKIFDECFQVGNLLHDRAKGLGIGLSIARRMARLLKGEVTFRSRVGRGSVFEISLPLAKSHMTLEHSVPQQEALVSNMAVDENVSRLSGWRVVVIEDDPVVATSIQLLLQTLSIEVTVFGSAELALENPEIMNADFFISDYSLPGLNGLQLLDAIQRRSATPINAVLLTGETSPQRIGLATSSRWPVLFKPAELSELLVAMNNAERGRRNA